MSDDDDIAPLKRWAYVAEQRGHAGMTAYRTPDEKAAVEWCFAISFREALSAAEGLTITRMVPGDDPPDIVVDCEGALISVELVELIDWNAYQRGQKLRASDPGRSWLTQQWDYDRYAASVRQLVQMKEDRYRERGQSFDVLLIYTDEPWLAPSDMQRWNGNLRPLPLSQFRAVYVMGSYVPGQPHYPLDLVAGCTVKQLMQERRADR